MQANFSRPNNRTTYPPWVVTFADLMSLLMTFFVLLFTVSTVDNEKYRAVSAAMEKSFGPGASQAVIDMANGKNIVHEPNATSEQTSMMAQRLRQALGAEIKQGMLEVETRGQETVVRFPERIAFQSGSESLTTAFNPVINKILSILEKSTGSIVVVGHTDDVPIVNERFRSNWDLSASRAVSVIHALRERSNLKATRLVAQGVADTQPLVPNDSSEHRAQNRRVEILIMESSNTPAYAPVSPTR